MGAFRSGREPVPDFFSRGGLSRAAVDEAVARGEIQELPAARGCTYVLPASDYALGLKVGQPFTEAEVKVALKLGVTEKELAKLQTAVQKALADGPLDTDELRTAVGAAARSLGPEGVKKGITTTLPVALGTMQSEGLIRRVSLSGRLDQQRYKYTLWKLQPEGTLTDLGRRYFRGRVRRRSRSFSGSRVSAARPQRPPWSLWVWKKSKTADDARFLLPEEREAFEKFETPRKPQYALTGRPGLPQHPARNLPTLLAPEDIGRVAGRKGQAVDLPNHGIFDRGRLIGLWEFDTAAGAIAAKSLSSKPTRL